MGNLLARFRGDRSVAAGCRGRHTKYGMPAMRGRPDRLLAKGAIQARSVDEFVKFAGAALAATPLKVQRVFLSLQALHPAFRARTYLWRQETGRTHVNEWPHGLKNRPGYYDSPDFHVHSTGIEFRVRDVQGIVEHHCDLYGKLRAEGYTDYLMVPLLFSDGTVNTLSIATKIQTGFLPEQLAWFSDLIDLFVISLERYAALETVSATLETYLGRSASREVLRGGIRAGHGELIQATILFADLHGFTQHSARLGPVGTVRLLNDYFDCLVGAIETHRGYVLKFIGDAILAFFPIKVSEAPQPKPVEAVLAIRQRLADLNRVRRRQGEAPLQHGLCLHFGEVLYGNVGSSERLDFTIIGPAVNIAERVVEATKTLKGDYLCTREFVDRFGTREFIPLGVRELRDSTELLELFALQADQSETVSAVGTTA